MAGKRRWTWSNLALAKEKFLRGFLKLESGIPSHDTFSRLFRLLDPHAFRGCFARFMEQFAETCQGVIVIDGKLLRRSFRDGQQKVPVAHGQRVGCRAAPRFGPDCQR